MSIFSRAREGKLIVLMENETRNKIIFILLMVLAPIGQVSIDFYATSLPIMAHDLHASNSLTRWIITSYLLAYGCGQILHGTLADFVGRKRLLLITLPIYGISTFIVPFFSTIYPILILRFIQGLAISATSVLVKSITADIYTDERLIKAVSIISISWGMSPIIAPLIGSYVQTYVSWQACFFLLGSLAVVVSVFSLRYLYDTQQQRPIFSWETFIKNHTYILKSSYFWQQVLKINVSIVCLLAFITQTPNLLQNTYHFSIIENGYVDFLASLLFLIGAQCSRKVERYQTKYNVVNWQLFFLVISSSLLLFLLYTGQLSAGFFIAMSTLMMCVAGILFPTSLSNCLQFFKECAGTVSGLLGFITLTSPAFLLILATLLNVEQRFVFPVIMLFVSLSTGMLLKLTTSQKELSCESTS